MTFDTELQRQQDATAIATQIKEQVKTVAENKNIDIEYNVDDALSLLNKIDDGTIATPTDTLDITDNGIKDVTNYASVDVNVVTPSQTKTATPTTSQQTISPDDGYLLSSVTVNAVTNSIDSNITPLNIREGITILGVQGNLAPDKPDQSKTATPTTSEQVIRADTGYELAQVTVESVTSSIDSNIQASNIKDGVTILGVTGTLEEGITPMGQLEITENGVRDVTQYASVNVSVETPSQEKTVTPTTSQQEITPDTDYLLSKVTVNAVTSAVDSNIQAGNIKDGVTILGVEGTLQEGITPTGTLNVTTNGSHDVSQYAIAEVNVPIGTQGGRYYSMRRWQNATTSLTGTMTFPIENFKLVKIRNLYWRQGNNVLLPTRVETTLTSWDSIDLSIAKVGTILSYSTTDDPIFEYCPVSSVEKIDTNIVLTINNLKQGLIIINSGEDNYILLGFAGTENSAVLNTTTGTVDTYYVYGAYSVGCPINVIPSGSATQMYTGQSKEVLFDDDSRPGTDLQNTSYLPFENGGFGGTTYGMHDNTVWGMFYEMRPLE